MVKVKRTFDIELIWAIETDPEIWATIAEDELQVSDQKIPDPVQDIYLALNVENKIIGSVYCHVKFTNTLQCHIHILPQYRRDFSKSAGNAIIEWILNNTTFEILYTEVPGIYSNVINYLKSFDFEIIGTIRACYTKNQQKNDVFILTKHIR